MRNRLDSIEHTHAARTSVHASAPPHAWLAVAHFLVAQMASLVAVPLTVPLRLAMIGVESRVVSPPSRAKIPALSRLRLWLISHMTDEWLIVYLATLLSVGAYAWYAQAGLTVGYGDAVSRMMIARRVVSGRATGLGQLGTTWLPLHTILMLPMIWNDTLFHSGFAGAFPSMVAYVLTGLYVYRIVNFLFSSRWTAWIAVLIFLLNPSILYMQSTAMSEAPLLCAASIAICYMLRWAKNYQAMDLVKSAAAVAASAGIRYDGWALAAVFAVLVFYLAWRRQGYAGAESYSILYGMLAFSSCAAWVIYNAVIFHDPLLFLFFGDSKHTLHHLVAYHKFWMSFEMFGYAAGATAGWMTTALAALGLILFIVRYHVRASALPVYALLLPLAYHWLIFYLGIDAILMPELGLGEYWNERFGLMLLPAIVVFAAYLAHQSRYLRIGVLGVTLAFSVVNATIETPMALREPVTPGSATWVADQRVAARWLLAHYHGGNVLVSYVPDAPMTYFMMRDIPDQSFITDSPSASFHAALAHPEMVATWVIFDTNDKPYGPVYLALYNRHDWQRSFALRKVVGTVQIYEYTGDTMTSAIQPASALQADEIEQDPVAQLFDRGSRAL